jgi:Ca-activated chloride channel family protein
MPAEAPPGDPAALGRIVGRLSSAAKPAARDWAELAGETLNWGSRLQSQGQPVLPGPVHDAIAGVKLGEKLDAKAADWGKLRGDLEALLDEKEREDKKDDQKQDKNEDQKKSDEQQQQDQQKDQQSEQQKNDQQQQKQQNQQEKSQEQKDSSQQQQDQAQRKSDEESALGDMTKKDQPPPPPPENMQQVGGAPERKSEDQQEKADPALALPLQKLDQLRNQDSPAQLFQMMEGDRKGERKNTPRTSKTW